MPFHKYGVAQKVEPPSMDRIIETFRAIKL